MLFRDEIVPPATKGIPRAVATAATAYRAAHDTTLTAEHAAIEARAAIERAKDRQHELDVQRTDAGQELAAPTALPKARAALEGAERASRVAREVEDQRERELVDAIDAARDAWREKQAARVEQLADGYLAQLDKLAALGEELGVESGVLAGLVRWRAGVGNAAVPAKTRGFAARRFQPADGRPIPADTEVMLSRLRRAAHDTATIEPITTKAAPRTQGMVDKINEETADKFARATGRR